jgi:hypothetical protein
MLYDARKVDILRGMTCMFDLNATHARMRAARAADHAASVALGTCGRDLKERERSS